MTEGTQSGATACRTVLVQAVGLSLFTQAPRRRWALPVGPPAPGSPRRRGGDEEMLRQMAFIGISGAFGGLMSTPIGGPLLAFELEQKQTHSYYFRSLPARWRLV